jgi:hypothetical protein
MSLFSWLFPAWKPAKPLAESSGLSRVEATRPVARAGGHKDGHGKDAHTPSNAQPANRKSERMARRELLYVVVREAMIRAGVLSSNYKFKVLSLDARGRQFLVMIDLARDSGGDTARLAEIEAMVAQAAKARHDIVVTAVYWRTNEHVAVGEPQARHQRGSADSSPVPLDSAPVILDSSAGALISQPGPLAAAGAQVPRRFDPIHAEEVAAFKRALAAGVSGPAALAPETHGASARTFDGSAKHGPQSYTLLTGYEDTEMPDSDSRAPALSGTQYGELR